MNDIQTNKKFHISNQSGLFATPIRLVMGWLFFSAFLRRFILVPPKLDPNSAAYVGYKFNNFLPNALWIKPMIENLLLDGSLLYTFLIIFTIIEGLVGLALFFGLGTRLAAFGSAALSWGILMGAGWLGSTCLDEWQIGVFGIAGGLTLLLTGGGPWSLDRLWQKKFPGFANHSVIKWISSGNLSVSGQNTGIYGFTAFLSAAALFWTLYTNQAFSGGVWGKLHNDSKKPHITITNPVLTRDGSLQFTLFRDKGPDTYGAFIVELNIRDNKKNKILHLDAARLSAILSSQISNRFPLKIHPGRFGLVVPLGSEGTINLDSLELTDPLGENDYSMDIKDVSGMQWSIPVTVSK